MANIELDFTNLNRYIARQTESLLQSDPYSEEDINEWKKNVGAESISFYLEHAKDTKMTTYCPQIIQQIHNSHCLLEDRLEGGA